MRATTPRGVDLAVDVHLPPGGARVPALVLAPGRGYHKDLPLMRRLAERAPSAGLAAFRFDWAYQTAGDEPSRHGEAELEDLLAVAAAAAAHPRVGEVVLVGKSMGTAIAWRAHAARPARALALLTPLLGEPGARPYPGLDQVDVPVLLLGGKADPLFAHAPALAHATPGDVACVTVGGDHGLNRAGEDSAWVDLAVDLTLAWAIRVTGSVHAPA